MLWIRFADAGATAALRYIAFVCAHRSVFVRMSVAVDACANVVAAADDALCMPHNNVSLCAINASFCKHCKHTYTHTHRNTNEATVSRQEPVVSSTMHRCRSIIQHNTATQHISWHSHNQLACALHTAFCGTMCIARNIVHCVKCNYLFDSPIIYTIRYPRASFPQSLCYPDAALH